MHVVQCLNPGYSRYIYGYYTWRQDLDGMNSWGPGTTENSRGNPFEDLDHEMTVIMPLHTPIPADHWQHPTGRHSGKELMISDTFISWKNSVP